MTEDLNTALETLHQNSITQVSIYEVDNQDCCKFCTNGIDRGMTIWDFKTLESSSRTLQIIWRWADFHAGCVGQLHHLHRRRATARKHWRHTRRKPCSVFCVSITSESVGFLKAAEIEFCFMGFFVLWLHSILDQSFSLSSLLWKIVKTNLKEGLGRYINRLLKKLSKNTEYVLKNHLIQQIRKHHIKTLNPSSHILDYWGY